LTEFKRLFGDITLDLTRADAVEGVNFINALLDTEPNRLSPGFRQALHQHTEGHPLFTIELLRAMQERGDLVLDEQGSWVESETLDWATLPARVEAVIEKRMARLEKELRDLLAVASVEGERFTAQMVARVQKIAERDVLHALSQELGRRHRLVHEGEELQVAGTGRFLSRFRFTHALFQEYLYQTLSPGERRLLHGEVAVALESLYGDQADGIAAQLAHHYVEAGRRAKAIEYSLRAGHQARLSYANQEAITFFQRGLALLDESPAEGLWDSRRLEALKGLGEVFHSMGEVKEAEKHLREAIALGKEIGVGPRELVHLYWWLGEAIFWQVRAVEVVPIAEEGMALLGEDTETLEAAMMNQHFAIARLQTGDEDVFREVTERTSEFIERLPYTEQLMPAFIHIVLRYKLDKDVEEALKWLEILEKKATPRHDLKALGSVRSSTAHNSRFHGDWNGAISLYRQALGYFAKIGDAKRQNPCELSLGEVYLALGDLQKAEAYALGGFESRTALGRKDEIAWRYELMGQISLCQGAWERAIDVLKKALQVRREIGVALGEARVSLYLGRVYLAQRDRREAIRLFKKTVNLVGSHASWETALARANALSGLEGAYQDPKAFRASCRRFRKEYRFRNSQFVNWYLEPAEPLDLPNSLVRDDFVRPLSSDWVWEDRFGDCSFTTGNGLEVRAANGRNLFHLNSSAPRLLRLAPEETDWAAQTVCTAVSNKVPAIGGLVFWSDEQNYIWLDGAGGVSGKLSLGVTWRIEM
jgi:tetratricopeptide (TPR) repeat protein